MVEFIILFEVDFEKCVFGYIGNGIRKLVLYVFFVLLFPNLVLLHNSHELVLHFVKLNVRFEFVK